MRRVSLHLIALVVLAHLPSPSYARQDASPPTPARTAARRRHDELAEALVRADSAGERDRVLAQNRKLLNRALVDDFIERGTSLRDEQYDREALALFRTAQKISEQIRYPRGRVRAIWHVGVLYELQENYDAAIRQASQALSLARKSNDEYFQAESLRLLGDVYLLRGNIPAGVEHLRQSISLGERLPDQYTVAWSSVSLANHYGWQGNDSESVKHYERAVRAFDLVKHPSRAAGERLNLANAYYRLTNYREALKLYEAVLPAFDYPDSDEARARLLLLIHDCYLQMLDKSGIVKSNDEIQKAIRTLFTKGKREAGHRIAFEIMRQHGDTFYQRGAYSDALTAFQGAMNEAGQAKDTALSARALKSLGDVHLAQGRLDLAEESYQKSLEPTPKGAKGRASKLLRIGQSYAGRELVPQALQYFQASLAEATASNNEAVAADARASLAGLYLLRGDTRQALAELAQCAELYRKRGEIHQFLLTLNKIGTLHTWRGDYRRAAWVLMSALERALGEGDVEAVAIIRSSLANNDEIQGDAEAAINHLKASLKAYDELQNRWGMANVRFELGRHYFRQGRVSDAVKVVQEGMNSFTEADDVGTRIKVQMFLGQGAMRQGNYGQARVHFETIQQLASKENISFMGRASHLLIGVTYAAQDNYSAALDALEKARPVIEHTNNHYMMGLWYVLTGYVYRGLGRDKEALQAAANGIKLIEQARPNVAGLEEEQVMFFAQTVDAYRLMVQMLVKSDNVPEALLWADRSKARVLLDMMRQGPIDLAGAMNPQERARKEALESQLAALNLQHQESQRGPQNPARAAALAESLQAARLELQEFQTNLYNRYPQLGRQAGYVPQFRAEDASALLPDAQSALLEYVVTDEEIFLFVATREPQPGGAVSWKVYQMEKPGELLSKVRDFSKRVARRDDWYKLAARELFDLLLKPAQEQLRGKTSLVIVPDGELWKLPFQALQTPANRYLLEEHAVSYAPSLATLHEMQRLRDRRRAAEPRLPQRAPPTLFALGDPAGVAPRLTETDDEVRGLKRIYGEGQSRVLSGPEATEASFKAEAGSYRVVHLATHGLLDASKALHSRIMLAHPGETSQSRASAGESARTADGDGLLEAREVMYLKLNADLVILSACESAQGRLGDGEGLIGLTWAFFAAGAPTTVASQWKVDSRSTTELMLAFHEALRSGMLAAGSGPSTSEALRGAALKLMRQERYRHPFYWAGFVVVGDGR